MKNKFKRFLVVMCVLAMAMTMTACGKEKKVLDISTEEAESLVNDFVKGYSIYQQAMPELEQFLLLQEVSINDSHVVKKLDVDDDGIITDADAFVLISVGTQDYDVDNAKGFVKGYASLAAAYEEIGDLVQVSDDQLVTDVKVDPQEDEAIINATIAGNKNKSATLEIIVDKKKVPTSITANVNYSFEEKMEKAGLNTLLGMGTVFVVLIFICILISLFKYIGEFEKNAKNKKQEASTSKAGIAADNAVAQIVQNEEAADDLELIAVISAAIAAYESANGGSSEGYQVRSIKRRA